MIAGPILGAAVNSRSFVPGPGRSHRPAPGVPAVNASAGAAGLRALASAVGNSRFSVVLARQVDTSKAAPIKDELESWWTSNAKLEGLWASLGTGLPEAIQEPAYKDLWEKSVTKEGISVTNAGRPVLKAFEKDVTNNAKSLVGSQVTRLEDLQKQLTEAMKQTKSSAAPTSTQAPTGKEDEAKRMSQSGNPPPAPEPFAAVRDLVDGATMLHFLMNWRNLLTTAEIGVKTFHNAGLLPGPAPEQKPPAWNPLPAPGTTPDAQGAVPTTTPPGASTGAQVPLKYDPKLSLEETVRLGFVDVTAFEAVRSTFSECEKQQGTLERFANEMMAADANLAVLAERGLLKDVSALSMQDDTTAAQRMLQIAGENAKSAVTFQSMLDGGKVDWKILRPVQGALLAGQLRGSANWSEGKNKKFVESWIAAQDKAAIEAAQRQAMIEAAFTAAAFLAMLTPASPLGAALMGASQAYFLANAAGGIAEASQAEQRAEALGGAAAAGLADKDEAARAKKEADDRQASAVVNLVMAALPYLPTVAKGTAKGIAAVGREFRWSNVGGKMYGGASLTAIAAQAALDFVVELGGAGISALAKNRVGGRLSLNVMLSRIKPINRELGWVKVTEALERAGAERQLHELSVYGLNDYIRYHIHGPGTGLEGYPILAAPTRANQFANNYIEGPMRVWAKAGLRVDFKASFATFSGQEMRPFVERMLKSGNPKILNRLALDQGLIEKFLKSITYDIRVYRGGNIEFYRADITVGAPGSNMAPVMQRPILIASMPAPPGSTAPLPRGL